MVSEIQSATDNIFWFFWATFCSITSLTTPPKIKNFKTMPGDITLHRSTINDNHTMYGF